MLTPPRGRPHGASSAEAEGPPGHAHGLLLKCSRGASVWDPRISRYLASGRLSVAQTGSLQVDKVGVGLRSPHLLFLSLLPHASMCGLLSEDRCLTSHSPDFPKFRFPWSLSTCGNNLGKC